MNNTWLFEVWPCIRWGLELRSNNLFSILATPSSLLLLLLFSIIPMADNRWCWLVVILGSVFGSLLTSPPGSTDCKPNSSSRPLLSPGNYITITYSNSQFITKCIQALYFKQAKGSGTKPEPQLVALVANIFHVFVYHQHEQSCHTVSIVNFHLFHSRRKLHTHR